jgi:hypothetical protein
MGWTRYPTDPIKKARLTTTQPTQKGLFLIFSTGPDPKIHTRKSTKNKRHAAIAPPTPASSPTPSSSSVWEKNR